MKVRPATESDFHALKNLFQLENAFSASLEPEHVIPTTDVFREEEIKKLIDAEATLLIVGEKSGAVTGLLLCHHEKVEAKRWLPEQNRLYIEQVFVGPDFRRQGVASALIDHAAQWGKSRGSTAIYLDVWASNTAARALYKKLGLEEKQVFMKLGLD